MRVLAALMLSMLMLTTTILVHAVATNGERPGAQPVSVADRTRVDHNRQLVVMRGR
jgi:hypothetical protein